MKKILFLFLLTAVLFKTNAQQNAGEYVLSLNGNWAFKTDPNDRGEREQPPLRCVHGHGWAFR